MSWAWVDSEGILDSVQLNPKSLRMAERARAKGSVTSAIPQLARGSGNSPRVEESRLRTPLPGVSAEQTAPSVNSLYHSALVKHGYQPTFFKGRRDSSTSTSSVGSPQFPARAVNATSSLHSRGCRVEEMTGPAEPEEEEEEEEEEEGWMSGGMWQGRFEGSEDEFGKTQEATRRTAEHAPSLVSSMSLRDILMGKGANSHTSPSRMTVNQKSLFPDPPPEEIWSPSSPEHRQYRESSSSDVQHASRSNVFDRVDELLRRLDNAVQENSPPTSGSSKHQAPRESKPASHTSPSGEALDRYLSSLSLPPSSWADRE